MEIVTIKKHGLKEFLAFKSERSKTAFQNNLRECRSIKLYKSDIVSDIGAYIGEYTVYCATKGVKRILSYEPTPRSFNLLRRNSKYFNSITPINMAVVGNNEKSVSLNISKGIGVTNSIVKSSNKAKTIQVEAIKYEEAVKDATIVKIDVEGAEYSYNIIQPNLRAIILEFHPLSGQNWKEMAYKIMTEINNAGFKTINEPTFKSGWDLTGSFLRS